MARLAVRAYGVALAVWVCLSCATPRPQAPAQVPLATHPEPEIIQGVHRVEPGETLYRLSRMYGVPVRELAEANGLSERQPLQVGQELVIPGAQRGPGAPPAPTPPPRVGQGSLPAPAARPGTRLLQWPLRGVLYARFGRKGKEPHDGIDLAAPVGTPVKAAAAGRVLYAGEQPGYGLIVVLEHGEGLVTLYAHNRELRVKTGQPVRAAQVIATVGESGRTSGPHLHFEVRKDGTPVDPLRYLGSPPAS